MALLNLFPPYLILLILVLVIFPTVLIALYKHLQESTKKVNRLSNNIDTVTEQLTQVKESLQSDLNQSTQSLASLTQDFQRSMTTMVELGIKITDLNQKSETILEQNQQRSVTEQEKLSNIQGELVKLIETVKTYQDSFNSESKQLGNQLINRLDERLSQTSDKILTASHAIERSSNNLDVFFSRRKLKIVTSEQVFGQDVESYQGFVVDYVLFEVTFAGLWSTAGVRVYPISHNHLVSYN